ncbi:MAG: hypothetical protein JWN64_519 [Parcubacteria group bacterium]|nr:hypothetical protein [Parcubacteria group bacterium]
MKESRFEMSGNVPPKKETSSQTFDWRDLSPSWISNAKADPELPQEQREEIETMEGLMETISELAETGGVSFQGTGEDVSKKFDVLSEEGMVSAEEARNLEMAAETAQSPLLRMIAWGKEEGVVTQEEAAKLSDWYRPN